MENNEQLYDELCLSIYNTNRYFHRLYGSVLDKYDLSYLQYMSLLIIYKKESVKLMDIGHELELSSNTLTPVIERLVKKLWIVKVPSDSDRRVKSLKITDSKHKIFEKILSDIDVIRDNLMQKSTRSVQSIISENQELNKILKKLIEDKNRSK
ncbi:MarR family transcriptional regulator [Leuconostoc litchii]|uniref:MarR family transcriptional regulator n=1 Tax=Leuconostoc litchii TaxID=1981069 RepID=A0A6P2CNT6_9LACO|nr:MarR family transcriptional regulator [Leuconostoc litchii]TYC47043.1 MarR family transcriptional regulator [Leuconostoc litchii]GMA68971.1 MarR family transcriptional regulator [Leuconostoc litchii]